MINAHRTAKALNCYIAKPLKTHTAPADHFGNLVAKLRKFVLGF